MHKLQVKLFSSSSESEKKKKCFQKESESSKFSNSPKTHPRPFYDTWWTRMCYNGEFKLCPSKVACMCSVYCRYILSPLNIASQSNALQCAHCGFLAETAALDTMAWFCRAENVAVWSLVQYEWQDIVLSSMDTIKSAFHRTGRDQWPQIPKSSPKLRSLHVHTMPCHAI